MIGEECLTITTLATYHSTLEREHAGAPFRFWAQARGASGLTGAMHSAHGPAATGHVRPSDSVPSEAPLCEATPQLPLVALGLM